MSVASTREPQKIPVSHTASRLELKLFEESLC
jgi:hypothetical protein